MSALNKNSLIYKSALAKRWMFSSALTAASLAVMAVPAQAQSAEPANSWVYDTASGNVGIDKTVPGLTNIAVSGGNGRAEGNADIYAGHSVNVNGDTGATFAYKDNRANIQSSIDGDLSSNMNILIIDRNGVFFGNGAHVNVAGLITTSGHIDDDQIMNNSFGDYVIENVEGGGKIELNGVVNITEAGLAAFVSPYVTNNGTINAKLGNVVMASGKTVTLDLYGDGLLEITVDGELEEAIIENHGRITAEGGMVQISALAVKDAVDNIINMEGVINVASVTQEGGKIILSGGSEGTVSVSGTLDASGTDGGEIAITGQNIEIAATAQLKSEGGNDKEDGNGIGDGGDIVVVGAEKAVYHGASSVDNGVNGGDGGFIEVSAPHVVIDGTFKVGDDGEVLIDPVDLCVFGASGSCGGLSSVDFITSLRPVLLGGGTVTVETSDATGGDGDVTIVGNLSDGGFETAARGTWNIIANDDITFGDSHSGDTRTTQTANLVATGAGLNINATSLEGGNGGSERSFAVIEEGSTINTGGGDFTSNTGNFRVNSGAVLDAAGGNININNSTGIFESTDADSIRTSGTGTIEIDQNKDRVGIALGSIQNVIDAIQNTGTGQNTINVGAGTYTENILIDKSISLNGTDNTTIMYDWLDSTLDSIITVEANNVSISSLTLNGSNQVAANGIYAKYSHNLIINNNVFMGIKDNSISIQNSARAKVSDNLIIGSNTGIFADNAFDIKVYDNEVVGAEEVGIHVKNSDAKDNVNDIDIWGNVIRGYNDTTTGILVENSDFATVGVTENNPFASGYDGGNKITGGNKAIVIKESDNSVARYNTITDVVDGINVISSRNAEILTNDIDDVSRYGIRLVLSDGAIISDNEIDDVMITGINAWGSSDTQITGNQINYNGGSTYARFGIIINGNNNLPTEGSNIYIANNKIEKTTAAGIVAVDTVGIDINNNTIKDGKGNGIFINRGDDADIYDNTILNHSSHGIEVENSISSTITNNTIGSVIFEGVNLDTLENILDGADGHGIYVHNKGEGKTEISGNDVSYSGQDGIRVDGLDYADISDNNVIFTDGNGISVSGTYGSDIKQNLVGITGENGILVEGGRRFKPMPYKYEDEGNYSFDDYTNINDNVVLITGLNNLSDEGSYGMGGDGIQVNDVSQSFITDNYVVGTLGNGISVNDGDYTEIDNNLVALNVRNGINVSGNDSDYEDYDQSSHYTWGSSYDMESDITNNKVLLTGEHGIAVYGFGSTDIDSNEVAATGLGFGDWFDGILTGGQISKDGYNEYKRASVELIGDSLEDAAVSINWGSGDGIHVEGYTSSETTEYYGGEGEYMYGSSYSYSNSYEGTASITNNNVRWTGGDGVDVNGAAEVIISDNIIGRAGINSTTWAVSDVIEHISGLNLEEVLGSAQSALLGDVGFIELGQMLIPAPEYDMDDSKAGIRLANTDYTELDNNDVSDNGGYGLLVEGNNPGSELGGIGSVVLTNNLFTNNPIGARFEEGNIDISDLANPNTFANTDPTATPIGMVFDNGSDFSESEGYEFESMRSQLSVVGNTLGATVFSGFQNEGSFYARIEDGTLLDGAGAPIVIDGIDAMFDGVRPNTSGVMIPTKLSYIEDRLYDADDSVVNGRGQIFVGQDPVVQNLEDFLNQLFRFNRGSGGLNVTIEGLPSIGAFRVAGNGAAALNLIAPAAGDEKGQSADDLANIEPKAGNEKASCWGDAISAASGGASVSYSFGSSLEQTLADASSCGIAGL